MKVRYEFGIFSTYIPGKELVESWFDYIDRSGSSSASFTVPDNSSSSKKRRIRGLNVCCAYPGRTRLEEEEDPLFIYICEIINTIKDLRWYYIGSGFLRYDKYEDGIIMLSHWRLGNLLEAGDHLTVKFDEEELIKEVGLKVVYEDEDEDEDERKEGTTSRLYNFNKYDKKKKKKKDIVTLSWNEEINSYNHLSDWRHTNGNAMYLHFSSYSNFENIFYNT